jgi:hypothetical protein
MDFKEMCRREWIRLANDRVQWQALLSTVINFPVSEKVGFPKGPQGLPIAPPPPPTLCSRPESSHCDDALVFVFQILGLVLGVVHGYDAYLACRQFRGYG